MNRLTSWLTALSLAAAGLCAGTARAAEPSKEGVEFFEKNIRPVLVESCYKCHSAQSVADKKLKGKFRADSMEGLLKGGDSGNPGIVPSDPEKSSVIKSIRYAYTGDDESMNMPPKSKKDGTGGKLKDDVIKKFEEWVKMGAPAPKDFEKPKEKADAGTGATPPAGAGWQKPADPQAHWAFHVPKLPAVPAVKTSGWAQNEVDHFVLAKLEAKGLQPTALLDRRGLVRRATFDLIGLPPTPEESDAFVADKAPDAYEKLIDRLLADPRYGEKWARHWLDIARYADTKGYVFQEERRYPYAYTYRDYVIRSFNEDKPYDRFLIEQIAADKLDLGADRQPLAAMGFLTVGRRFLNNIHDIIDDRMDVVFRGTMALTVGCARCHDHKFDPIPTRDYYSLHGIFASSDEPKDYPLIGDAQGAPAYRDELKKRQAAADGYLKSRSDEILSQMRSAKGIADYLMAASSPREQGGEATTDLNRYMIGRWKQQLGKVAAEKDAVFVAWRAFAALPNDSFESKSASVVGHLSDGKTPIHPLVLKAFSGPPPKSLREVADRYGVLLLKFDVADKRENADEESLRLAMRGTESPYAVPEADLAHLFKRDSSDRLRDLRNKVAEWQATSPDAPARAMVLNDSPSPHDSNVLVRGNPGNAGVVAPRQFLACVSTGERKLFKQGSGRLELAQAIASKENPLTARVFANRMWLWHFGSGLVKTPSDFGVRSDPPSHPELLDWLAVKFEEGGWSIKKLHKLILLSGTYQQDVVDSAKGKAIDPENTLLWRQNRQRLEFEEVRDTLLAVSGQIDATMFGRSVDISRAEENRRTIYGFVDRQNLPSMFRSFDFASPDTHSPQRFTTTVPQQALFFMNSPFSLRQTKLLLTRKEVAGEVDIAARIRRLYLLLYGRPASLEEVSLGQAFIDAESKNVVPAVPSPQPVWQYGYGSIDPQSKKVIGFTKLSYQGKRGWRGGPNLPDPKTGFVTLSEQGGHPGDAAHAAIRRWISPAAGSVDISGMLSHGLDAGDGVHGRIVSSHRGTLGEWQVRNGQADTAMKGVSVEAGETIDFVVESGLTVTSDSFGWAPSLRLTGEKVPGGSLQFSAARDFVSSSIDPAPVLQPLTAWEKYVQVLLSSNEFVFVD